MNLNFFSGLGLRPNYVFYSLLLVGSTSEPEYSERVALKHPQALLETLVRYGDISRALESSVDLNSRSRIDISNSTNIQITAF